MKCIMLINFAWMKMKKKNYTKSKWKDVPICKALFSTHNSLFSHNIFYAIFLAMHWFQMDYIKVPFCTTSLGLSNNPKATYHFGVIKAFHYTFLKELRKISSIQIQMHQIIQNSRRNNAQICIFWSKC